MRRSPGWSATPSAERRTRGLALELVRVTEAAAMAAARQPVAWTRKRGDQAAVSPLLLMVEPRKRGDLDPGLTHWERALLLGFHLRKRCSGARVVRGTMTRQWASSS
jgi:hypothetical protein